MRQFLLVLVFVSSCLVLSGCSPKKSDDRGNEVKRKGKPYSGTSLSEWPEKHEKMTRVLRLDEQEQATLKQTFEEHTKILKDWYAEHGEEYANSMSRITRAAKNRNAAEIKRVGKKSRPLRDEALRLHAAMDRAVLMALSEQKRREWVGYLLSERMFELTMDLNLDDAQKTKLRELAVTHGGNALNASNPSAKGMVDLEKAMERQVLTPTQKGEYQKVKKRHPMRTLKKLY